MSGDAAINPIGPAALVIERADPPVRDIATLLVEHPLEASRNVIDVEKARLSVEAEVPTAYEGELRPWARALDVADIAGGRSVGTDVVVRIRVYPSGHLVGPQLFLTRK
jgi:hypothetical protein